MDEQGRILVLDDMGNWQDLLKTMLEAEGYRVDTSATLEEAKSILQRQAFHLAIVDIRLDESDPDNVEGMYLLDEIKEHDDGTSMVMLTGHGTATLARDAFAEYGVLDFVEKIPRFDSSKFKVLVREGIKTAFLERRKKATVGFMLEPYLGGMSLERLSELIAPEVQLSDSIRELNQLLRRLLYEFLPLAPQASRVRTRRAPTPTAEILCWSRGIGEAIAIRLAKRLDLERQQLQSPLDKWHMEEREVHSTPHFAGIFYVLTNMPFEGFLSVLKEIE